MSYGWATVFTLAAWLAGYFIDEAQRKGCGQCQRSEAAHERLSGHFFFFEVFHDVFSFC